LPVLSKSAPSSVLYISTSMYTSNRNWHFSLIFVLFWIFYGVKLWKSICCFYPFLSFLSSFVYFVQFRPLSRQSSSLVGQIITLV